LLAWLRVQRGDVRVEDDAGEMMHLLTRAVRRYPDELEIRLYRARVLQRLGRGAEALRDFTFVANADARNVEAARELRLHRIRSAQTDMTSGVLSWLFGGAASVAPAPSSKPPPVARSVPAPAESMCVPRDGRAASRSLGAGGRRH
jgi:hypothetical protein